MPNEKLPVNAFKKGHKKVGGRPPGRRNILTNDLKEALLKFLSRALTALNLEPSMATLATLSKSSSRHSATKLRQTSRMALPLSLRKSAMVLKSGANCPVSQTSSILRWHSRSRRRLDETRLR